MMTPVVIKRDPDFYRGLGVVTSAKLATVWTLNDRLMYAVMFFLERNRFELKCSTS